MPLRRCAAVVVALAVGGLPTACSSSDGSPATATASPTAVGDRPLVRVLQPGSGEQRLLAYDVPTDSTQRATLRLAQEVVTDDRPRVVPPFTVPFDVSVNAEEDLGTSLAYGEATVEASGASPADVRDVRRALAPLAGTSSTLVVRTDGTLVEAGSGVVAAGEVDAQVRDLLPVLPPEEVGVGATWTATSVDEVGGATVDQVATYTLRALDGDAYVVDVTVEQTYRPGELDGVTLRSGRSTISARLEGTLDRLLPGSATGTVSSQLAYVVDRRVSEVRTTIGVTLTTS